VKRQLPKRHDLAPLLKFKRPVLSPIHRRLAGALTIEDLRRIAKRRTPKAAFDYTDGAADGEVSLARAREAFADLQFNPAVLRDVSDVDTSRDVLGSSPGRSSTTATTAGNEASTCPTSTRTGCC
jgi:L-lactate dehydrogenase (cytochrome)